MIAVLQGGLTFADGYRLVIKERLSCDTGVVVTVFLRVEYPESVTLAKTHSGKEIESSVSNNLSEKKPSFSKKLGFFCA